MTANDSSGVDTDAITTTTFEADETAPATSAPALTITANEPGTLATPPSAQSRPLAFEILPLVTDPTGTITLDKTNTADGEPATDGTSAQPGDSYTYDFSVSCSSIEVDCVDMTFTETFPPGVVVDESTIPPSIPGYREVMWNDPTLTVVYTEPLDNPPGETGLTAGTSGDSFQVSVELPADTPLEDGDVIPNTASASTFDEDGNPISIDDPSDVTVDIPVVLDAGITKGFSDPSAIAGDPNATTTVDLTGVNESSNSAEVTEMTIEESDPEVFEYLDFTAVTVTQYPAGAAQAQLYVCPQSSAPCDDSEWVAGGTGTPPGPSTLALPGSVPAGDVVGVRVVFTAADGSFIENQAGGGTAMVDVDLALRDTVRSSGVEIATIPSTTTVDNTASIVLDDDDPTTDPATDSDDAQYQILPPTIEIQPGKSFFPDDNGNYSTDGGEHAVIGENSGVSMILDATNASAFPISEITITEPATSTAASEFEKFDPDAMQLAFPAGAANAEVVVTYDGAPTTTTGYPAPGPGTIDLHPPTSKVTSITVTFTGDPTVDGGNTIEAGTTGSVRIHGNLNDLVDQNDVNGPSEAAGIDNCVDVSGTGTPYPGGTGQAVGTACAELPIEERDPSTGGEKVPSQTNLPTDQPIDFTLRTSNNGNIPLLDLTVSDPPDDGSGIPPTPDENSVFYWGEFVDAYVLPAAMASRVTIQVYTPTGGWDDLDTVDSGDYPDVIGVRGLIDVLNPTESFDLHIEMIARDPAPDGDIPPGGVVNCYGITADTTQGGGEYEAQTHCSPPIIPGPITESASINKAISPETLPRPIPGLDPQTAQVTLQIHNTGTISARLLQITDNDPAFWDAVDFTGIDSIQTPAVGALRDANQVRIDAWVDPDGAGPAPGSWTIGTVTAPGSPSVPVPNDQVRGLRFTFTDSSTINDGYVMTTCPGADVTCAGVVEFDVTPREALVSTGVPLPDTDQCPPPISTPVGCSQILNTATGALNTRLHPDDADPALIPEVTDDLILVPGTPALDVEKGPANATVQPGQLATFTLVTTNSGTANLPDVTVSDPMPDGILFDDSFADTDTGQPYTVTWSNLPDGYAAPPDAVFETTPDPADSTRVGLVRWTFPGWDMPPNASVSIVYRYTLEPGVQAGDTVVNTMGASSPVDDLACSDVNDGQVTDGDFGDGPYCTDPANVTVTAGANFVSRKWVAGTPELGWYNQATGQRVAIADAAGGGCLSLDANGRTYTTNPCIALTNPGEDFHYVLRVQNAGTEPALTMTIVDTFPAPADTGVFGAARGTQWANAPTLAGPATYSGPPTGTIEYTTGDPCAGGSASWPCNDATWTSTPGANTTALRLQAGFDPDPLPPAGIVDVSFSMTTPIDVPRVSDPTVAYNSIAHSETTQIAGGGVRNLTPVEPLKVGVATMYGDLQVEKVIGDNPANLDLDDVEFTFTYECTLTNGSPWPQNGTVTATPTTPGLVTGIPSGSTCDVWESGTNGGITDTTEASPATVVIEPSLDPTTPVVATVTVTNDFPLGELSILKDLTGFDDTAFVGGPYPILVDCTFNGATVPGFPQTGELVPGTPLTDIEAPVGSVCTVVETDDLGATTVTYDPANAGGTAAEVTVPATDDAEVSVGITNDFPFGSVTLLKSITGGVDPVFTSGPFTVEVTCGWNDDTLPGYPVDVDLEPGVESDPFVAPVGSECAVVETDDLGATTVTYDPANAGGTAGEITVPVGSDADPVTITVSNDFPVGGLQVNKQIGENDADLDLDDIVYTFAYTCTFDTGDGEISSPTPFGLLTASVNDPAEVDGLPAGAVCEVWETVPGNQGGIPDATVDDPAVVTIEAGTLGEPYTPVTVTNDYPTGRAELVKLVDGDVREDFTDGPYEVLVNCWAADQTPGIGTPFPGFPVTVQVTANDPVAADLPVGTTCWFQEQDIAAGVTAAYDPATITGNAGIVVVPAVVAPDDGVLATVSVTNTYEAGSLVIDKTVSGPGAPAFSQGPFVFGVRCSYLGVDDAYSAVVVVPGSDDGSPVQSDPVTGLPIGAECIVTEIDNGGADIVTPPQTVTIEQNQQANVAFVGVDNPFSAGTVAVVKQVDGTAAASSYVAGLRFDIDVECSVDVNGTLTTVLDDTVAVAPDGLAVTVSDDDGTPILVPLGARCWAAEPDGLGARAVTIEHDSYDTGVEVVADAAGGTQPLEIEVTNTFDAAALTLTKVAINAPTTGAVYTFTVACTITRPDGTTAPVPLLSGTSPVSVAAGESVTFDVLAGSTCVVTESGADGATVTYTETGGETDGNSGDGTITLLAPGSVTATNTYAGALPSTGSDTTLGVLRAAAQLTSLGILALVVAHIRRRRVATS